MPSQLSHTINVFSKGVPGRPWAGLTGYFLVLASIFFPVTRLTKAGEVVSVPLWAEYPSIICLLVSGIMAFIQARWLFNKHKWLAWPGWVAGVYSAWFAIFRIWQLSALDADNNLAASWHAAPGLALWLILAGGLLLLLFLATARKRSLTLITS